MIKKREKPEMGTRLVPSIGNIEGCYKYGGAWDNKYKLCLEKNDHCTAPIKGVRLCWWALERESPYETNETEYVWEPVFDIETINNTGDPNIFNSFEASDEWFSEWPDDDKEALESARYMALDMASDVLSGHESRWGFKCFTPRGKRIGCNQPNAVLADNAKQVAKAYKEYFKEKSIPVEFSPLKPIKRKNIAMVSKKPNTHQILFFDKKKW